MAVVAGMIMGPEGRRKVRTKRSQSAGGEVAAVRWDHQYAVLTRHSGVHLYNSQGAPSRATPQHAYSR